MQRFNENPATIVTPLIRYGLIALGGGLISKGYVTLEHVNAIAGALVTFGTTGWMIMVKRKAAKGAQR